jgi:hypothetical protein
MEVIAEFSDNEGLNCKLTKDRLYITSLGNEEIFALRGINGVGIYDDIVKFNEELELYKDYLNEIRKLKLYKKIYFVLSSLSFVVAFYLFSQLDIQFWGNLAYIMSILFFILGYRSKPSEIYEKPKLESYVRLILSGGERNFLFNKSDKNSVFIADFINKLEKTLTAHN